MLIVILLVPDLLCRILNTGMLEATLYLLAHDNLVVQMPEVLPWLLVIVTWEPYVELAFARLRSFWEI
jgi:hypothetical protein